MADRRKPTPRAWQRMLSGRRLNLIDPSPLDIEIDDIAHGLARVARWNGQTIGAHAFSVAQHTIVVDAIAVKLSPGITATERLAILLHDAPEYVIGDMISPFKALLGGDYKIVEARLLDAIHRRFGVPVPLAKRSTVRIKAADKVSAYFEAISLAGFERSEAVRIFGRPGKIDPGDLPLDPWPASLAERRFLKQYSTIATALTKGG
jgi:uncharacterized protein